MSKSSEKETTYSQFACIGSGFSAIALGASLQRWYGITDVRFFERHSDLGGTWFANQYPGCACDVPSLLYSLSFAPNPAWKKSLATADELWQYIDKVADDYNLRPKMVFRATVETCQWIEETHRWRLFVRDGNTGDVFVHESQFLYAGSGLLVHPRKADIQGIESFNGPVFHSSQWRHDVDLTDKNIALVGNGCTAAQILPAIQNKTKHVTQFIRSKHWVIAPFDMPNNKLLQTLYQYLPGFQAFVRFGAFMIMENEIRGFFMTPGGASFREDRRKKAEAYMRSQAPKKYHDLLIPDFEIGCKRRIFDSGYLKGLNADNVTLTDDRIVEVLPDGIRTDNGFTKADVIVLANGFETNSFCTNIEIIGRNGVTAEEHWKEYGGGAAYNTTSMSGFPNFFLLLGPNTATGHTSTLLAAENAINYSLRLIKPILQGKATAIDVKKDAEDVYVEQIQRDLQKTVFFSGCNSWYNKGVDDKTPRNSMTYPYTQPYFWYSCLFPIYKHFKYDANTTRRRRGILSTIFRGFLWTGVFAATGGIFLTGRNKGWDFDKYLPILREQIYHLQKTIKF